MFMTYMSCEHIASEVQVYEDCVKPVECWTLGILTYERFVGQAPFIDEKPIGIYLNDESCPTRATTRPSVGRRWASLRTT